VKKFGAQPKIKESMMDQLFPKDKEEDSKEVTNPSLGHTRQMSHNILPQLPSIN